MTSLTRRDAAETTAVNLALAAIGFLTSVGIARHFGEVGRGEITAFMLWPSIGIVLANMGLPHAASFFAANEPEGSSSWVGTAAVMSAGAGLVGAALTVGLIHLLLSGQRDVVVTAALMMVVIVVLQPLIGTLVHPWRVLGKVRRWNGLRLVQDSILLLAVAAVVLLGSHSYGTLVGLQVVGTVVLLGVVGVQWLPRRPRFRRRLVVPLLSFGLPTLLATLPYFLNFRIDQAFLSTNTDSAELGQYAVAVGWSLAALPLLTTSAHLALPRIGSAAHTAVAAAHVRLSAVLGLAIAAGLTAVSPILVPLIFGSEFEESGRLAVILVPATCLLGFGMVIEEVLRALGRPRPPVVAQVLGLTITLGGLPWATVAYGAWGAAWVSLVAYTVATVALIAFLSTATGTSPRALLFVRRGDFEVFRRRGSPVVSENPVAQAADDQQPAR